MHWLSSLGLEKTAIWSAGISITSLTSFCSIMKRCNDGESNISSVQTIYTRGTDPYLSSVNLFALDRLSTNVDPGLFKSAWRVRSCDIWTREKYLKNKYYIVNFYCIYGIAERFKFLNLCTVPQLGWAETAWMKLQCLALRLHRKCFQ